MTPSLDAQERVIVETSSGDESDTINRFRATIRQSEMNRLTLVCNEKIAELMPVRVQGQTLLWLGEVVKCTPESEAMWAVHVRVKRSILIV